MMYNRKHQFLKKYMYDQKKKNHKKFRWSNSWIQYINVPIALKESFCKNNLFILIFAKIKIYLNANIINKNKLLKNI